MLIIGISILLLFGTLSFLARKEPLKDTLADLSFKSLLLKDAAYLYRRANRKESIFLQCYKKISKKEHLFQKEQVVLDLHTLEPMKKVDEMAEQYYQKKLAIVLLLVLVSGLLIIGMDISERIHDPIAEGNYIKRYKSGEGERHLYLNAWIGEEQRESVELSVTEQKYSKEQLDEYATELIPLLEKLILGENDSADSITKDMRFVSHVEGYPFTLQYSLDNTEYINQTGILLDKPPYEEIDSYEEWHSKLQKGVITNISVTLQYETYKTTHSFDVCIREKEKSKQQKVQEQLQYLLLKSNQESMTEDKMELPQNIEGKDIVWEKSKSKTSQWLLGMLCMVAILLYVLKDKELHDSVLKREMQLRMDYPEIVSKITLLTGAGLTVRNCFYRIAGEYKKKREQGYEKHYAYEEILLTVYEMENGISEVQAYENYGKRCKIQQYIKLSALLMQNIKKSSSGVCMLLQKEASDSFEQRKSMAKKLGEEAGTKLLLPMILMLGIVMMIVFYPAMTSFAS